MSILILEKYLPAGALPFLKDWFGTHTIHIKITRNRNSKLGDYRRMPDKSHQITINSTLPAPLFFFVLTHELAHLIAFDKGGYRIAPHGREWKQTFGQMLTESLPVYPPDLQIILRTFCRAPKANFMSSPDLVRYFHIEEEDDRQIFIEEIGDGAHFVYRRQTYRLEGKRKKNYLCENLDTGKKYIFKPLARVEKLS